MYPGLGRLLVDKRLLAERGPIGEDMLSYFGSSVGVGLTLIGASIGCSDLDWYGGYGAEGWFESCSSCGYWLLLE